MAVLGQTDFGQPFWQTEFDLLCVVCRVFVCAVWRGCWFHGFVGVSREGVGFKVLVWSCSVPLDRPSPGPPKFRSFFFPSPAAKFVLFFPLWGVFSLNFGGVFEGRDPQIVDVWALGLSCETLAAFFFFKKKKNVRKNQRKFKKGQGKRNKGCTRNKGEGGNKEEHQRKTEKNRAGGKNKKERRTTKEEERQGEKRNKFIFFKTR